DQTGLADRDTHVLADRGQHARDKPALGGADKRGQSEPKESRIHKVTPQREELYRGRTAFRSDLRATSFTFRATWTKGKSEPSPGGHSPLTYFRFTQPSRSPSTRIFCQLPTA